MADQDEKKKRITDRDELPDPSEFPEWEDVTDEETEADEELFAEESEEEGTADVQEELTREEMLARLRKRTEEESAIHSGAAYERREREKRSEKRTDWLGIIAVVFALIAAFLFYYNNYAFSTYSVDRTIAGNFDKAEVYAFGDGILVTGTDSLSYYVGSEMVWTEKVALRDPIFETQGDYFAVSSREGYYLYVGGKEGISGSVKLSRKIREIGVSASGVAAVYTASDEAAYISYFDRYGNRISVELKTVLVSTGYPVKILVSPDGQKLAVLYYSIQNGIGESRLVIYDFENGRESSSYITAVIDDYYDTDTFLIDGRFTDDSHLTVIGDNRVSFLAYSSKGITSRADVPLSTEVRSVLFSESYLYVISGKQNTTAAAYASDGSLKNEFTIFSDYDTLIANDKRLILLDKEHIEFYNLSGRNRYRAELVTDPQSVTALSDRTLAVNVGNEIEVITIR